MIDDVRKVLAKKQKDTSLNQIAIATEIPYASLHGFAGGGDLRADNFCRLAEFLGFVLVEPPRPQRTRRKKAQAKK